MENKKQLPAVLRMRAERILQKAVKAIYKTANPSVAECILTNDQIVYVDLDRKKKVSSIEVNTEAGKEDTEKLTTGNFHSAIKRPVVETAPTYTPAPPAFEEDADAGIGEIIETDMKKAFKTEAPKDQPKKRQTKKTK